MPTIAELKARVAALDKRISHLEGRDKEVTAIVAHMRKHRIQQYLRRKLGDLPATASRYAERYEEMAEAARAAGNIPEEVLSAFDSWRVRQ